MFVGGMFFCQYMCQLAETNGFGVALTVQQIWAPYCKRISPDLSKSKYILLGLNSAFPPLTKKIRKGCMHMKSHDV